MIFRPKYIFTLLIFQLTLTLTGCSGENEGFISPNAGEVISLTASIEEGIRPLDVNFSISSAEVLNDAYVSFGDRDSVSISNFLDGFSHTYTDVGTFTATLTGSTVSGGLFSDTVEITVLGDVNLIVSSFAIDRTINVKDSFNLETVSAIIQNTGSDALVGNGYIEVGYYLSTDDVITVDDILIGDTSIAIGDSFTRNQVSFGFEKLSAGDNYQFNHQLAVKRNIPTGTYYAGAIVDFIDYYEWYTFPRATDTSEYVFPLTGRVYFAESNEEDNTRTLNSHQVTVDNKTCISDKYEDDDSSDNATTITVGSSQSHNFCFDNSDWVKFDAVAGSVYKISTDSLGLETDTQLILYDRDGSSILLFDDNLGVTSAFVLTDSLDSDGIPIFSSEIGKGTVDLLSGFPQIPRSEIVWEAEFSGTYFVKIRTTACDEDRDTYCDGDEASEGFFYAGSPDGVGLDTEYTISLQ